MVELKPVYEHEVTLKGTATKGEEEAAAMRARLASTLIMFADSPECVVENLKCRDILLTINDRGDTVFKRELAAGNVVFHDTVTVAKDRVTFAVPAQGDMHASTYDIYIEGGVESDVVFRFHYEEEAVAHHPEQIQALRNKAWQSKDQDLAAWCIKKLDSLIFN